ncbi:hypothetical protein Ahy_B09g098339 [Arachis hypogaea]|uniref:Uncharacterized protein n=1 Tax=Arachis hypogaea TaxID=3818 RepID=A0A444XQZ9_ARAHY|nr:hypothetical protein Ahy_B09g098339 [Arachis hypogaea]
MMGASKLNLGDKPRAMKLVDYSVQKLYLAQLWIAIEKFDKINLWKGLQSLKVPFEFNLHKKMLHLTCQFQHFTYCIPAPLDSSHRQELQNIELQNLSNREVEEAEVSMQEAQDYLDSVTESAMDEFRRFEEELESMSKAEMESLVNTSEGARKMGNLMEKAASIASKKYIEAALNSATASMKSAWKGISSGKVHPS